MIKKIAFILTIIGFCSSIYGYWICNLSLNDPLYIQYYAYTIWVLMDAIAKVCFCLAFVLLSESYLKYWLVFIFALTINNLLNEIDFLTKFRIFYKIIISIILIQYYIYIAKKLICNYRTKKKVL